MLQQQQRDGHGDGGRHANGEQLQLESKGALDLGEVLSVGPSPQRRSGFILHTADLLAFELEAANEEDKRLWVEALTKAIKKASRSSRELVSSN